MTGNERRIKRRIKLIIGSAMFVFFGLCVTLSVQLAIMANQNNERRQLEAAQTELRQQLINDERMYDFINSDRFLYEYALRNLGVGRPGSSIFR